MTARLIPLSDTATSSDADEVTIYVKGFLGRGETSEGFDAWLAGHRALEASHGWSTHAYGFHWEAGTLRKLALPVAGSAKMAWDAYRVLRRARRINPLATAGWFLAEQGAALSVRFVSQFVQARRQAQMRAEELAESFASFHREGRRVRVVAHSLGCRQVIEASARLPVGERPQEIHLCAPACREDEVADKLHDLAQGQAWLYYTPQDQVLELSFRAMSQGRAIGAAGIEGDYAGLAVRDVSDAFGFWVHTEYKNRFGRFVERPGAPEVGRRQGD